MGNRPPGVNGQAAAKKKNGSETSSSRSSRRTQGPPLRLIRTPEPLYQAHADLRNLARAYRLGLISAAAHLHLGLRAQGRLPRGPDGNLGVGARRPQRPEPAAQQRHTARIPVPQAPRRGPAHRTIPPAPDRPSGAAGG